MISTTNPHGSHAPIRVFVFLGAGFGAARWQDAWKAGSVPGICDRLPYGYFHAANESWRITYSEDRKESAPFRLFRKSIQKIVGFDMLHAWYNRNQLSHSDVVWTHTEREYLAALCLWRLRRPQTRPKLIAQSVWLFDRWKNFSPVRRALYRMLIRDADILTALSPENLREARRLFPAIRSELVRFGIDRGCFRLASRRQFHRPIRILSLGTDMHRDWGTLIEAVRNLKDVDVRIASRTIRKPRSWPENVAVLGPGTAQAVKDLYDWADLVVVPLKRNLHASGITVIAEAVSFGLPIICTDTGGLRAYFNEQEIVYVSPSDSGAIRTKIEELAANPDLRFRLTAQAQIRFVQADLTSYAYAIRHRNLSESLLQRSAESADLKSTLVKYGGRQIADRVAN